MCSGSVNHVATLHNTLSLLCSSLQMHHDCYRKQVHRSTKERQMIIPRLYILFLSDFAWPKQPPFLFLSVFPPNFTKTSLWFIKNKIFQWHTFPVTWTHWPHFHQIGTTFKSQFYDRTIIILNQIFISWHFVPGTFPSGIAYTCKHKYTQDGWQFLYGSMAP